MNALFLDDDLAVEVSAEVLQDRHPEDSIEFVYTLEQAHEKVTSRKYDVLVIDLMMPPNEKVAPGSSGDGGIISGLRFIEEMQKDRKCLNCDTPIIILTGVPTEEHKDLLDAVKKYGDRFITKPVGPEELYESLRIAAGVG